VVGVGPRRNQSNRPEHQEWRPAEWWVAGREGVGDHVEAADHRAPGRVVGDARDAQPGGRVDDAEIDAELVEPVV